METADVKYVRAKYLALADQEHGKRALPAASASTLATATCIKRVDTRELKERTEGTRCHTRALEAASATQQGHGVTSLLVYLRGQ